MNEYRYAPSRRQVTARSHLHGDSDSDKIFIFGFSRGAYAARALAGMLSKVRLPQASHHKYHN